ncbi:protein LDOC1-like [Ambystoma mexicanum]|uniref:protein LDOC1-like n=1 Tax=Ambystoma mexicanum TaxID=8296 RepID=UPI0037E750F7
MEEIAQVLHELKAKLAATQQDYATLATQVRVLTAQGVPLPEVAPTTVQVQVTTETPVPLPTPERYGGDPQRYTTFMTQCQLHFLTKTTVFRSDQARTAFVISYLTGDAAAWTTPLVQKDDAILYD